MEEGRHVGEQETLRDENSTLHLYQGPVTCCEGWRRIWWSSSRDSLAQSGQFFNLGRLSSNLLSLRLDLPILILYQF